MVGFASLVRPVNCAMSAVAVLLGGFICLGRDIFSPERGLPIALAMIAVVLFVGAGNALNDYEDRRIDKIAHPHRPLPSGRMKPKTALSLSIIFFSAAVVMGLIINITRPLPLLLLLVNLLVMVSYEKKYKKEGIPGNLSISWLTSSLFLFGAVSAGGITILIILFIAMAFLASFTRELIKDIQDMSGDKGIRRTAPIIYGRGSAGWLAALSIGGAVALSPIPFILGFLPSLYYMIIVLVADAIFIYSVILLFYGKSERSQIAAKTGMLVALIAFASGVAA